jgi:SAM-dependent methyltransferase
VTDFDGLHKLPDGMGYDATSRRAAWLIVEQVIGDLESILPGVRAIEFRERVVGSLHQMDQKVFAGVNARSRDNPEFEAALTKSQEQFADGRAVHLELGTWSTWPNERVEDMVASDRLGDVIRLDLDPQWPLDVAASATALPFADESIDRINSNSLLEHVPYPHEVLRESFRVLRPGGMFITTVPFHFVGHGCPGDYLRYTGQFFQEVCADIGFVEVVTDTTSTSGLYYTTHQLAKAAIVNGDFAVADAARVAHLTVMALLAALRGLDDLFYGESGQFWHSTRVVAAKPGGYIARNDAPDRSMAFVDRYAHLLICPVTGLPVCKQGNWLVSLDGRHRYDVVNGVPRMVTMHGFASSITMRSSSREQLRKFSEHDRRPLSLATQHGQFEASSSWEGT